ncbi:uncharacterized protein LOC110107684 [Dendrobium catenatum]|uniref:uncharacterized protein LOC110107684 n=1 Tax=Dendrobium catenatum TaxID=906689 RepID=UPI0009F5E174|nr:uncharacterized protein LOC110107684 [Dendrobium catenatum]
MRQPKGFEDTTHPDHVYRLHKAIYDLKQAPRQTSFLVSIGFTHTKSDPSLLLFNKGNVKLFLLIYVNDILLTGNDHTALNNIIMQLQSKFLMKILGLVSSFLGIKISRKSDQYFLTQKHYAHSILQSAQLTTCKPLSNPTCTKLPQTYGSDPVLDDPNMYRCITGSLQYLTLTRPDISFSVNLLSQHMHQPQPQHVYLLKWLLRYIQGTLNFGIPILKSNLRLSAYSDADWAGDPISRKSTSGYCSYLGNTLISWTVKKQTIVARSSTEFEYRSLAALAADVIWI